MGTAKWEQMIDNVLAVIEMKFKYIGGPVKYWDREYYNPTLQGD